MISSYDDSKLLVGGSALSAQYQGQAALVQLDLKHDSTDFRKHFSFATDIAAIASHTQKTAVLTVKDATPS